MFVGRLTLSLFLFVFAQGALLAAPRSTVHGTVTDPTGSVVAHARIFLTASEFRASTETDARGRYSFSGVPAGEIELSAEATGFSGGRFSGELRPSLPLTVDFRFASVEGLHAEIRVVERDSSSTGGSTRLYHDLEEEQLEKMPLGPPREELSAVVETVPGVVPEENGRLHVRGSETAPQYVLDGVPLADNLTGTYATGMDIENLEAARMITGNIPAEFGDRSAAVVTLSSKSGLDSPWNGSIAFSGGSFDSAAADAELGGHVRNLGVFVTADTSRNRRFLDPPEIGNFRNRGGLAHLFARFDWLATKNDVLRLTLATSGSDFQVPNFLEQEEEGQRERQELRDDYQAVAWSHTFSPSLAADVSVFRRSSTSRLLDPDRTGMPYFLEQSRRQRSDGVRAGLGAGWKAHQFKAGFEAYHLPLGEHFTLAVSDPEDVDPDSPLLAYTPDAPFRFDQTGSGHRVSWYVQDRVKLFDRLTVDAGLRFDAYRFLVHDDAWSPRVGLAYLLKRTNTVFRASYNRLFQTPPLENLLLSSSTAAARLSEDPDEALPVPAERQNAYEFGVQQSLGRYLRLDLARYIKNARNFSDDQQLFATAVVFPVAISRADVRGTEVRLDVTPLPGLDGYASYANARATGTGPLVGGMFLGEAEGALVGEGEKFPADADERNEVQFGVTYAHRTGAWLNLTGRYDSGIPAEFEPEDFDDADPRIQAQIDPARRRIRSRTVLNVACGIRFFRESRFPVSLQFGVNNLTDSFYLYNFHSVFSGTHVGRPREVAGRIVFSWSGRK
jgi:TonB dependent receptor/Carboxypeptidase regulatory-like domain